MKELDEETYQACLSLVKSQKQRIVILKNFGLVSIWIEDIFAPKGIGQEYNELTGREITKYMHNYSFYSAAGKSILDQAQGTSQVTIKFGHDEYIRILNVD